SSYHCAMCGRTWSSSSRRTVEEISRSSSECSSSSPSRSMFIRQRQYPRVDRGALLERGAQRAVQPVLQVQPALPLHDVREQVAVERGVLGEQAIQGQLALGRGELV